MVLMSMRLQHAPSSLQSQSPPEIFDALLRFNFQTFSCTRNTTQQRETNRSLIYRSIYFWLINAQVNGWHAWKRNIKSGSEEGFVSPGFRTRWCDPVCNIGKWGQRTDQVVHVNKTSTLCSSRLRVRKKVITVRRKNHPTCLYPLPQVSA